MRQSTIFMAYVYFVGDAYESDFGAPRFKQNSHKLDHHPSAAFRFARRQPNGDLAGHLGESEQWRQGRPPRSSARNVEVSSTPKCRSLSRPLKRSRSAAPRQFWQRSTGVRMATFTNPARREQADERLEGVELLWSAMNRGPLLLLRGLIVSLWRCCKRYRLRYKGGKCRLRGQRCPEQGRETHIAPAVDLDIVEGRLCPLGRHAGGVRRVVGGGTGAMQATLQLLGIASCRQAAGISSFNAPMYRRHSSSLLILPTVLNPPFGSLKNAVQLVPSGSYAKQLNVWALVDG